MEGFQSIIEKGTLGINPFSSDELTRSTCDATFNIGGGGCVDANRFGDVDSPPRNFSIGEHATPARARASRSSIGAPFARDWR